MIEGQEGVSWDEWVALARACEEDGLDGLFRSDHYRRLRRRRSGARSTRGRRSSALAAVTERIRLGTMVSPATFRHPSVLAKHGRDRRPRLRRPRRARARRRLERARARGATASRSPTRRADGRCSRSSSRSSTGSGPRRRSRSTAAITGSSAADAQPKPVQRPHPPLIMGGAAGPARRALAARWADEYNTPFATLESAASGARRIDAACERRGASRSRFSLMTGCCRRA